MRDWLLLGPLSKNVELDPVEINPEEPRTGKNGNQIKWHRYLDEGDDRFGSKVVDLKKQFGENQAAAYAYTEVKSDRSRTVTVSVGSDDSISVWVNGEQVLDRPVSRPARPDQDVARVQLQKWRNRILVRNGQKSGGWGFYFRITNRFGRAITEGIEYVHPRELRR